jgi:hypothetical protein
LALLALPHTDGTGQSVHARAWSVLSPAGPTIVDTHSKRLSPFGPAEQFGGGSLLISASSFCIRLAEDERDVDALFQGLEPEGPLVLAKPVLMLYVDGIIQTCGRTVFPIERTILRGYGS